MSGIERLIGVMASLRDPETGCPWDREQTAATLVRHTLEEAYEVAEAVEQDDAGALREELGDLLFQVVFYARIAEEQGQFDFEAVASGIAEKLIRRHPHVFGDARVGSVDEQSRAWEQHKAGERRAKADRRGRAPSHLDGVSTALPGLARAQKLQQRAARVGFDWPSIAPVLAKLAEEVAELQDAQRRAEGPERLEHEVGDVLFTCVNLARHAGVDAETALRGANRRFVHRFGWMEERLAAQGRAPEQLPLDELDRLWEEAKALLDR